MGGGRKDGLDVRNEGGRGMDIRGLRMVGGSAMVCRQVQLETR